MEPIWLNAIFALWPLHVFCVGLFALIAGADLAELRKGRWTIKLLVGLMVVVCLEFAVLGMIIRSAQSR